VYTPPVAFALFGVKSVARGFPSGYLLITNRAVCGNGSIGIRASWCVGRRDGTCLNSAGGNEVRKGGDNQWGLHIESVLILNGKTTMAIITLGVGSAYVPGRLCIEMKRCRHIGCSMWRSKPDVDI